MYAFIILNFKVKILRKSREQVSSIYIYYISNTKNIKIDKIVDTSYINLLLSVVRNALS